MNDQKKSKANLLVHSPSMKKPVGLSIMPSKIKIDDEEATATAFLEKEMK